MTNNHKSLQNIYHLSYFIYKFMQSTGKYTLVNQIKASGIDVRYFINNYDMLMFVDYDSINKHPNICLNVNYVNSNSLQRYLLLGLGLITIYMGYIPFKDYNQLETTKPFIIYKYQSYSNSILNEFINCYVSYMCCSDSRIDYYLNHGYNNYFALISMLSSKFNINNSIMTYRVNNYLEQNKVVNQ